MATDTVKVTFKCKKCGGTALELPDNHTDRSVAKCKSCGVEVGTWGDIQKAAQEVVADKVSEMFRDTFKGKKGWTVK